MRRGFEALAVCLTWACATAWAAVPGAERCERPLYLTFDTGHMGVAPLVADVLHRQQVRVTFFAANEPTREGDGSLGQHWSGWWRQRAQEGHEFASHTYDHVYWRGDLPGQPARFRVKATAGPASSVPQQWSAAQYCQSVEQAAQRLEQLTGQAALPLFRAPGGKTSPRLLAALQACGWRHVGWAPAGFLGDELPSDRYPNARLLSQALRDIRSGDILMAHLGIWSRQDAWAPAVLEPLLQGLKGRGFCFQTLSEHPDYRDWVREHARKRPH